MIVGEFLLGVGQHVLCIFHVDVGLVIITHHADGVFPCACIDVEHVVDEFVHHVLGVNFGGDGKTTYTAIGQFLERRNTFAIGKQCEIFFSHIRVGV